VAGQEHRKDDHRDGKPLPQHQDGPQERGIRHQQIGFKGSGSALEVFDLVGMVSRYSSFSAALASDRADP
jgi:hypothetical protein